MAGHERRRHPRVDFPVLVLYRSRTSGELEPAYAADLSLTGLRVTGGVATAGATVDLQLVERGGHRPIDVLGEVVWAEGSEFAVRFVDLDDAQRTWLEKVIEGRSRQEPPETEDLLEVAFDER